MWVGTWHSYLASSVSGWQLHLCLFSSQNPPSLVAPTYTFFLATGQSAFIKWIWVTNLYSVWEHSPAASSTNGADLVMDQDWVGTLEDTLKMAFSCFSTSTWDSSSWSWLIQQEASSFMLFSQVNWKDMASWWLLIFLMSFWDELEVFYEQALHIYYIKNHTKNHRSN